MSVFSAPICFIAMEGAGKLSLCMTILLIYGNVQDLGLLMYFYQVDTYYCLCKKIRKCIKNNYSKITSPGKFYVVCCHGYLWVCFKVCVCVCVCVF